LLVVAGAALLLTFMMLESLGACPRNTGA
jgi:hypothetical protein